jgi:ABC-type multidrug transport system fused ATPase/permease subunit|tara:strand:+ start:553 stop:2532 length:1980 start_codon:yes stop_codon:yes gene_type:complete
MSEPRFDDRIDLHTELTNLQVFSILRRTLAFIWPVRRLFIIKFFLMCGSVIPILVAPWPVKIIVDHVILQQPIDDASVPFPPFIQPFVDLLVGFSPMEIMAATIVLMAGLVFAFGAGDEGRQGSIAFFAQGEDTATQTENMISAGWSQAGGIWGLLDLLWNIRLVQGVTHLVRYKLFERLMKLPMQTLDDNRIGDSVYRVMYDTPTFQGLCFDITLTPSIAILTALASLYVMQYSYGDLAPQLIWVGLLSMPAILLVTIPLASPARHASQASRASGAATTDTIEESMSNISAVQSLGNMAREHERFSAASQESFRHFRRVKLVGVSVNFLVGIVGAGMLIYVYFLVTTKIIDGVLSAGDFMVLMSVYFNVALAAGQLGHLWIDFQNNAAAARRVFLFMDLPSEASADDNTSPPLASVSDGVRIENADFTFPDGRQALRAVNFSANVGELIAIVGPTGAGKTTLAYLIPGYYRPNRGRVSIDGEDIANMAADSLRQQVTYVFQEHQLFSETIAENIRFGSPEATQADVQRAATTAGATQFIDQLPQGYSARLGRGGNTLSVGQKQRLCIARGLARNTPVLILDEPTSSLDVEAEADLLDALQQARRNRLLIVIAHRLSTIRSADRIVFMEAGTVLEDGTHTELMARQDGAYRHFVELQTG